MICEPLRVRTRAPAARRLKFTVASKTSQIKRRLALFWCTNHPREDARSALQRLNLVLSRGGVPLPDRDCGADPGSSIQGRVLALLFVSLVSNNASGF